MVARTRFRQQRGGGQRTPKLPGRWQRIKTSGRATRQSIGQSLESAKKSIQAVPGKINEWWQKPGYTKKSLVFAAKTGTAITGAPKLTKAAFLQWRDKRKIKQKMGVHIDSMQAKFNVLQKGVNNANQAITKRQIDHNSAKAKLLEKYMKKGANVSTSSRYKKELNALKAKQQKEINALTNAKTKAETAQSTYIDRKARKLKYATNEQGKPLINTGRTNSTGQKKYKDFNLSTLTTAKEKQNALLAAAKTKKNVLNANITKKKQESDTTLNDMQHARAQSFQLFQKAQAEYQANKNAILALQARMKNVSGYTDITNGKTKQQQYQDDYTKLQELRKESPNLKTAIEEKRKQLKTNDTAFKKARDSHNRLMSKYRTKSIAGREARYQQSAQTIDTFKKGFNYETSIKKAYGKSVEGYSKALGLDKVGRVFKSDKLRGTFFKTKSSKNIGNLIAKTEMPEISKTGTQKVDATKRARRRLDVLRNETARRLTNAYLSDAEIAKLSKDDKYKAGDIDISSLFNKDAAGNYELDSRGFRKLSVGAATNLESIIKDTTKKYNELQISNPIEANKMHGDIKRLIKLKHYVKNYGNMGTIDSKYSQLYLSSRK